MVMCDCMKQELIKAGFKSSGLGALIGKQTFDNFSLEYYSENDNARRRAQTIFNMLKNFADNFNIKY